MSMFTPAVQPFQTSMNPSDWTEHPDYERLLALVEPGDAHEFKRRLYPLSCRLVKYDKVHGLKEGLILRYCRTKLRPALYPIEAIYTQGNKIVRCHYDTAEVELLPPENTFPTRPE